MRALSLLLFLAPLIAFVNAAAGTYGKNVVPFIPQSFFFDWNDPNAPLPNPTTAQCSTINIKWARGAALGPNPVSPYTLLIHTSLQTVPYVIDAGDNLQYNLTIPFPPGTQYEVCMFDKNGATGGCQAVYTVYPSSQTAGCANLTLPSQTLNVQGLVDNGPISQFGWVDQCTDISLVPKSGTPPFTMLVSPALHPPYKIMSNDMSAINWTVSLSWASPFFISLTDANGLSWTNGPLHSGGGGPTACLSTDPVPTKSGISTPVVVGSSVGGLVLGAILGAVIASFCVRGRYDKVRRNSSSDSIDHAPYIGNQERFKRDEGVPHTAGTAGPDMGGQYLVEPFIHPTSPTQNTTPPAPTSSYSNNQSDGSATGTQPHVYVVHHDGGGAPVTVYTGGSDVTELPPSYIGRPDEQPVPQPAAGGSNNSFDPTERRPRPGPTPRKPGVQ